mgnify:CR=1 FL=1
MGVYALTPSKHRAKALILGEAVFVGWRSAYALIPLGVSILNAYLLGMLIDNRRHDKSRQKGVLAISLLIELSIILLAVLSVRGVFGDRLIASAFPPVGVFVYTLGAVSYCVDIYRGTLRCDHRFSLVAAFVGFFPCVTAGPLMRFGEVSSQLEAPTLSVNKMSRGISLYLKGLAERVILSTQIAGMWRQLIRLDISGVSAITAWLGLVGAGMYVYFEYAAISHMARGVSLMLGIELPVNFDHPFKARSVTELVKKFNASVTSWFIDYIYTPIKGEGRGRLFGALAAVVTGTCMSLWYGADLSKLVFGVYVGLICLIETSLLKKPIKKLPYAVSMVITMILIHIGFVFFIADDTRYALSYILAVFGANGMLIDNLTLYFFENFIVIFAVCVFITTGLAELIYKYIEGSRHSFLPFIRPVWQLALLVLATAFLSGSEQGYLGLISLGGQAL